MNNELFIKKLNNFQNSVLTELLHFKNKLLFVKGSKFTGKTTISKKLFEIIEDEIVLYHTGCNPDHYIEAFNRFKKIIDEYKTKNITMILDEFYDLNMLNYIFKIPNITCYIFTNDKNVNNPNYINYDYYSIYQKFIVKNFNKYFDINQILFEKGKYFEKEKLRTISIETKTIIKYKGKIFEDKMEFKL